MPKKRKPNLFRILVLVAILLSVISIGIGSFALVQNYKIKHTESMIIQNVSKGANVYYDGTTLTMPVSVTITNQSYNNVSIKNISYTDQVFFTALSSEDVKLSVYSFDTTTVTFNVTRTVSSEEADYFNVNYGANVDISLTECYAYLVTGDKANAETNADDYQNKQIELSFTTAKGTKYSN